MTEPYTTPKAVLTAEKKQGKKVSMGIRFLSLCMIIGAIVSIGTIGFLSVKFITRPVLLLVFIPFVILFIVYIVKGISLWKGKANAYKWAFWLFVIQIPIISIPGFSYHLFTGLVIAYRYGDVASNLIFNLGGGFNFYISHAIKAEYYGVNLFALVASIYLLQYIWKGWTSAGSNETSPES